MQDRRLFFASLRMEVIAAFGCLDAVQKRRWTQAASQLVDILQLFESQPENAPGCSMIHAVELACEFMAQIRYPFQSGTNQTLH